ncbi:DUF2505 domain-containing protein [Rothia nasimurium]|uniref:DUF2505 domain-containing protein n=1 Tax=Rothia nasimurium TaxID=85336 RepID=UPI001F399DBA|nr:DUF2505 domain-containing protein [Rothia nasimurium]
MAVQSSTTINASIDNVIRAFADENFARFASEKVRISFESFSVDGDPAGAFTATTVRAIPADRIPDMAKKLPGVSNGVSVSQVDRVSAPAADGSRTVVSEVTVKGIPVTGNATQTLTPAGETTEVKVDGEVKCSIPLVGKKIAAAAEPQIGRVFSALGTSAEEYIKANY